MKEKCVFNQLQTFHAVSSLPPDLLHDLMEGVIPQDLLGCIRILVQKGWFALDNYNQAITNFKFSRNESLSKPQLVPTNPKVKKLKGKAISHWVHIRNFFVILSLNGWIEDAEDNTIKLMLLLEEITGRLTAEEFRLYEVEVLDELVIEYLDLRHVKN